jgi:hypothetical protein
LGAAASWALADLDRVSSTRPLGLMHASGHILNLNTRPELAGLLHPGIGHPGIPLGPDGLTGGLAKSGYRSLNVHPYPAISRR